MTTCLICGAEIRDAFACTSCGLAILDMVWRAGISTEREDGTAELCLLDELDLVISRQTRSAEKVGGRSAEKPLPYDARASKAHVNLSHVLSHWAKAYGMEDKSGAPRMAARFLARHGATVMKQDVASLHAELEQAVRIAQVAIDVPPVRSYVGVCSAPRAGDNHCRAELYADAEQRQVTCPLCKNVHDVNIRREVLMRAVEDVLASATEIARAVYLFDEPIKVNLIHQWKSRGKLQVRGFNEKGGPLYRVGDILALVRDSGLTAEPLSDTIT